MSMAIQGLVISAFDDCDISGKAVHLAGNIYNDSMMTIEVGKDSHEISLCRRSMVIILNYPHVRRCKQRDHKPSRLPLRTLNRLEKKSKKLRDIDTNRQKHFLTAKMTTKNTDIGRGFTVRQLLGGHYREIY